MYRIAVGALQELELAALKLGSIAKRLVAE
jgi:hypothetical protein